MDMVEGEAASQADCFATMILIYLRLTVSVETSKPHRSNEILLKKGYENEIKGTSFNCESRELRKADFEIGKNSIINSPEEKDFS